MTRQTIQVLLSSLCPLLLLSVLWMFMGNGDESNLERAKTEAKRGDAAAEYFLGRVYFQGKGVAQDYGKAAELFRRAAEQGNAKAQNDLGVMFESGLRVEQNLTEAFNWFSRSAEQGDANGQCNLGRMYATGSGVEIDLAKAYQWLSLSTAQGEATAKSLLARMEPGMTHRELAEGQRLVAQYQSQGRKMAEAEVRGEVLQIPAA
jgi:uncharacterized protein